MIKMGDKFYDERNDRYLTVDGQGNDPKCFSCIVEELNEDGDDYEVTDRGLFLKGELEKMNRV